MVLSPNVRANSKEPMMLNDAVKTEVSKINEVLDNYQRGRYSKTRAEDRIFESAQRIIFEVSKKGIKDKEAIPKV